MTEDVHNIIRICVVAFPIFAYLAHALYFRIQARMHEFMLTLVVSTLPLGLIMIAMRDVRRPESMDLMKGVVEGLFPSLMLFGGSIWGLSAARRMNEQRTWHRLGMMLIGWLTILSFLAFVVLTLAMMFNATNVDWSYAAIVGLIAPIPSYLAIRIELACHKVPLTPNDSRTH